MRLANLIQPGSGFSVLSICILLSKGVAIREEASSIVVGFIFKGLMTETDPARVNVCEVFSMLEATSAFQKFYSISIYIYIY